MNFAEMKVGHEYKLRNGELVKCISIETDETEYPVLVERADTSRAWYTITGKFYARADDLRDAVEEIELESDKKYPKPARHKNADFILEYARQKAEGELKAGWWDWYLFGSKSLAPNSLTFNDEETVYSYKQSDLHPDNANSLENKIKVNSRIFTKNGKEYTVYQQGLYFTVLEKTTNTLSGQFSSLALLVKTIKKANGEITDVVL